MSHPCPQTAEAFSKLLEVLKEAQAHLVEGPFPLTTEADAIDAHLWITTLLNVALRTHMYADPMRPEFLDIVGANMKWGGDNADAFYQIAAVDPRYRYRVRGQKGDAAYLALAVYGGTRDGDYAEQHVEGTLNDRTMVFKPDGSFEITLSADEAPGNWLKLEPDAVCVITRDYLNDAVSEQRATFTIENADPVPPPRPTDAETAERWHAVTKFIESQLAFQPIPMPPANEMQEPMPGQSSFGWAAGDAMYAMGAFELEDGQALVIRGKAPECAFWNVCLWNPLLHTYDYRHERVTINGAQCSYDADGSFELVVSPTEVKHPNWLSTAGRSSGFIWFRWFLSETLPEQLETEVVDVANFSAR